MLNPDREITTGMIAACGIMCSVCIGHMREKNACPGCYKEGPGKPRHCVECSIRKCPDLKKSGKKFCYACLRFPCARLSNLDKRYRTKYGMSMLENLETIRDSGVRKFAQSEKTRWTCPACSGLLSAHRENCPSCGQRRRIHETT